MTTDGGEEVSRTAEAARGEAERWANEDPAYAELMSTYVEMAELLNERPDAGELRQYLRDLWLRNRALEQRCTADFEEAWALWCAHNMASDGGERAA